MQNHLLKKVKNILPMNDLNEKILYLFTVNYPFSHGEHLLEYEINYLKEKFDKIFIICTDTINQKNYKVSKEIEIIRYRPNLSKIETLFSIKNVLNSEFYHEIIYIRKFYKLKLSYKIFIRLLLTIQIEKKISIYLKKLIKDNDYKTKKLVFYSWWTTEMTLGFAYLKKEFPNIKTVTRARAIDLYFERHNPPYLPLRNYLYNNLDAILCISEQGKNYITNKLGMKNFDEKIHISRMGSINRKSVEFSSYKNVLPFRLVSCSNIIPLKRIHLIIEALSKLNDISIEWIHFGKGELREKIYKYADSILSERENIKYSFRGYINNRELMHFYEKNQIDLFINVSEYEGTPVTIMEANSYGIPAIATDVGGVSELVNKENGFLLSGDTSAEEISKTILEFYQMTIKQKIEIRRNAYNTWNKYYNADRNFNQLAKLISDLYLKEKKLWLDYI